MPKEIRYGRGVLFPFRFDGAGDFAQGSDEELVRSDIHTMFAVERGELAWDGDLGQRFRRIINISMDTDGLLDELLRREVGDVLAADARMSAKTLILEEPTQGRAFMRVKVNVASRRGANPVLRDVEERIRLR